MRCWENMGQNSSKCCSKIASFSSSRSVLGLWAAATAAPVWYWWCDRMSSKAVGDTVYVLCSAVSAELLVTLYTFVIQTLKLWVEE